MFPLSIKSTLFRNGRELPIFMGFSTLCSVVRQSQTDLPFPVSGTEKHIAMVWQSHTAWCVISTLMDNAVGEKGLLLGISQEWNAK